MFSSSPQTPSCSQKPSSFTKALLCPEQCAIQISRSAINDIVLKCKGRKENHQYIEVYGLPQWKRMSLQGFAENEK